MTNCIKIIVFTMAALAMGSCTPTADSREAFVRSFFERYPKATLQDVYKGSFQDVFGPAHILTDRQAVRKYIESEMKAASGFAGEDFVPCGWKGQFYQVNLKVIADGRVPMEVFVDAFMQSANGIDTTLTPAFVDEWKALLQTVRWVHPDLEGFAQDSTLLARLLAEGKYVVHHSRQFDDTYQPHYRIIRRDLFEEHILPRLYNK